MQFCIIDMTKNKYGFIIKHELEMVGDKIIKIFFDILMTVFFP